MKDRVAILVAWPWLGGAICEIRIPMQELRLKMYGAYIQRGAYMRDAMVSSLYHGKP